MGLRCKVSTFDSSLLFIFRNTGSEVGASTGHIDGTLGCGEPGVLSEIRKFPEQRFGGLKLEESSSVRVGMELVQESDF